MKKRITTSVTYELPIKDLECVKEFVADIPNLKEKYNKNDEWEIYAKKQIEIGLKVVFVKLWDLEEQWFEGLHFSAAIAIEAFIGYKMIGSELYSMGDFAVRDIETLCNRYENEPDFVFEKLDWKSPKEVVIKEFLNDLLEMEIVEATPTEEQ